MGQWTREGIWGVYGKISTGNYQRSHFNPFPSLPHWQVGRINDLGVVLRAFLQEVAGREGGWQSIWGYFHRNGCSLGSGGTWVGALWSGGAKQASGIRNTCCRARRGGRCKAVGGIARGLQVSHWTKSDWQGRVLGTRRASGREWTRGEYNNYPWLWRGGCYRLALYRKDSNFLHPRLQIL